MQKKVFLTYFKTTFLLIATFFLGAVIATGVARLMDKSKTVVVNSKPNPTDFRDVFVLKNTVREGKEILPENVIVARLHKNEVPRGVVKTYQQIDGRAVRAEISQGTVLLDEYFVPQITQNAVNGFIPPGFHAVTIQVHEMAADGQSNISAVIPGDQVDVIIVQKTAEDDGKSSELVLLEKIPVIDTYWDAIGDFQSHEKKGTVSLLLSDSQRKNLEVECQDGAKIRLRVCSPAETQIANSSQPRHPESLNTTNNFYQTGNSPELLSRSINNSPSQGDIEIVFYGNTNQNTGHSGQELKIHHNELQIPPFHGIPVESYADKNTGVLPASAIAKPNPIAPPDLNRPAPRYLSYYDASAQKKNRATQWQTVIPRSPVVYEAQPDKETQTRGLYQENGVYYSVD
jgi:Flp pilus assembly protein CpaB